MKIKVGDILICKNEYIIYYFDNDEFILHENEGFKLLKIDSTGATIYIYKLCRLDRPDKKMWFSTDEIEKFFYSLSEWRDKQINSIFEDEDK